MGTRFDMIGLFVNDLQRMVAFYRDVLGFDITWDGSGLNGTFELAIDLPTSADADREYERVIRGGSRATYAPHDEPWGMHSSMVADPEGNIIEIGSWNRNKPAG